MATAAKQKPSVRSKAPTKWVVRMGAEDGSAPTSADETKILRWPQVTFGNGSRDTFCNLTFGLDIKGDRIQDVYLTTGFARQIEIVQVSPDPAVADILIFWGEVGGQQLRVTDKAETVGVVATIEPYHFGSPCLGPVYISPIAPFDDIESHDPIVFNPENNGKIEGNMSLFFELDGSERIREYWVHPDSVRTAPARVIQGGDQGGTWTLARAVLTMCGICNPSETYITNPTETEFNKWLADAPAVKNLELPTGKYLPEYLDLMLNPFGYGWAMTFKYDSSGNRVVSFRVYKLNNDPAAKVLQQKPGDTQGAKLTLTNVASFALDTTLSAQANQVTVLGGFKEYEITVELYRGWLESEDSLTASGLTQSTGSDWATHQRAWRLWVGNEGGDYCSTRTVVAPIPATALDLTTIVSVDSPIRTRKPLDCLTHWKDDGSGERRRQRPPFIEWYTSGAWKPLPAGWGETVLDDQIGVMFAGDAPPAELIALGDSARIRMTFTIQSDVRINATATRSTDSVNLRTNEIVIDAHDRYKYRHVVTSGSYTSTLAGLPSSEEQDDSAAIVAFAEKLRVIEDAAIMRGTITMFGIHPQFKVGQTLENVKGRNVSLNRMAKGVATKKYLQVTQISHDHQKQETVLKVAPILESIA